MNDSIHPLLTLRGSAVENCPLKPNQEVLLKWTSGVEELAVIDELKTSMQGGKEVVHAIMVRTEDKPKPFVVSPTIIYERKLF